MRRLVARTGLVAIAGCALVGIDAATTVSARYRGVTDEVSAVVGPAIWLVVAIVAGYAAIAPTARRITSAATLTVIAAPVLALVGVAGFAVAGIDVPVELQLSRAPLRIYLSADAVALAGAIAVAIAVRGLTPPATPARPARPC